MINNSMGGDRSGTTTPFANTTSSSLAFRSERDSCTNDSCDEGVDYSMAGSDVGDGMEGGEPKATCSTQAGCCSIPALPALSASASGYRKKSQRTADAVDLVGNTNSNLPNNIGHKTNKKRQRHRYYPHHQHHPQHHQHQHQTNHNHNEMLDGNCHPNNAANPYGNARNSTASLMDEIEWHLGLIGWRKKCLYILLLLLMLLIITNLALTLWILKVMEFSTEGMGQLKIIPGGIQVNGETVVMDILRASNIRSRPGQAIAIESSRNFSINTRDTNGELENLLFLGHDKLECLAKEFRINDTNGRNLFSVNRNEVSIGAHALRIDGDGGAIFRESIQTPHVRAEPGRELRLESPTRQMEITAAKELTLQSRAGDIQLTALNDIKLTSSEGSLRFETSKIFMPNLRTAQLTTAGGGSGSTSREHLHRVFQLCACSNGKLFLAPSHSICAGDDNSVCR